MKLPLEWLSDYTDLPTTEPKPICDALTMSGSKVEGYEVTGSELERVVVGEILTLDRHPDADRLQVCRVGVGADKPLQIVTGASNIKLGDKIPLALHRSVLAGGVKIKKGKLRGVVSEGMMCSLEELGLSQADYPDAAADGIFILPSDSKVGSPIQEVLDMGQVVVEFEITSNRPDCFSAEGLGREAAITFDRPFRPVKPQVKAAATQKIADALTLELEAPELCRIYSARLLTDVKIEPSPAWLRRRLQAAGIRPINNIVDITNYCMLELGQPLHAFDLRDLKGGKIVVRRATENEAITTLDGGEHCLTGEMLVIADAEKPVAVAGVMGGENSEVKADTTAVVFESAVFAPASVRETAKKLGLRTESSARYERGLDAAGALRSLDRACELAEQLGAGRVSTDCLLSEGEPVTPVRLELRPAAINAFLGTNITADYMADLLLKLGCKKLGDGLYEMPGFRPDLQNEADLAEEVARFYGYNRIPSTLLAGQAAMTGGYNEKQQFIQKMKDLAVGSGYFETCTYSFGSRKEDDKLGLPENSPLRRHVELLRAPEDYSVMRTTLLPSMLQVVANNYSHSVQAGRFFEVAYTYHPKSENKHELPQETEHFVAAIYDGEKKRADGELFYQLKGLAEEMAIRLGLPELEFKTANEEVFLHPYRTADIYAGALNCGYIGTVHPEVADRYAVPINTVVLDLLVEPLLARASLLRSQRSLPKFPAVHRDLAFVVATEVTAGRLREAIADNAGPYLESCHFFDIYTGSQVAAGKKSLAYKLTFRKEDGTLTDEVIDRQIKDIIAAVGEQLGGILR